MRPIVWSKDACQQCDATKRLMTRLGIDFEERNLENYPAKVSEFRDRGFLQAPIVEAGDEVWSGFRPDRITALTAVAA